MPEDCEHLEDVAARKRPVTPSGPGCQECLRSGSGWVHLRLCMECGHVGCCDNSPNRHATKHFKATGHPVIRSYEPEEDWAYCYEDDVFFDHMPALSGEEDAPRHYSAPML